jgi:hypothetical protein
MASNYTVAQSLAVRRQTDMHSDSISLCKLLKDMCSYSEYLTSSHHEELYKNYNFPDGVGRKEFAKWCKKGETIINTEMIEEDIQKLNENSELIKQYVNKHVAHHDKKGSEILPTFSDLDCAVDTLGEIFSKYREIVTSIRSRKLVPEIQDDWLAPLRIPWISGDKFEQ